MEQLRIIAFRVKISENLGNRRCELFGKTCSRHSGFVKIESYADNKAKRPRN